MMLLPALLATAALALPASAFVVPPDTDVDAGAFWHKGPDPIELACPGCPFAVGEADGMYMWAEGNVENSLLLNFTLDNDRILLNGKLFHPIEFPHLEAFYAPQRRESASDSLPEQSIPVRLGYALEVIPLAQDENEEAFKLQFTVFDLGGFQVHIPTVRIQGAKEKGGRIPLITVDFIPVDAPDSPSAIGMECKTSLCRMRAMIVAKLREVIQKAKEAAAAAKNSKPVQWVKGCHNKFRGGRPHKDGKKPNQHSGKPHHHHHKSSKAVVSRIFHRFLIPLFLGMLTGLAATAVGVASGHAIVFLWTKYRRGGRHGLCTRVPQEESAAPEEKQGLMEDVLPQYEELEGDVAKVDEKE